MPVLNERAKPPKGGDAKPWGYSLNATPAELPNSISQMPSAYPFDGFFV